MDLYCGLDMKCDFKGLGCWDLDTQVALQPGRRLWRCEYAQRGERKCGRASGISCPWPRFVSLWQTFDVVFFGDQLFKLTILCCSFGNFCVLILRFVHLMNPIIFMGYRVHSK